MSIPISLIWLMGMGWFIGNFITPLFGSHDWAGACERTFLQAGLLGVITAVAVLGKVAK